MTDKDDDGILFINCHMGPWVRVGKSPIEYFGARPETYLTKPPGYYLTGYEGSPCERIEPVSVEWTIDEENTTYDLSSEEKSYQDGFAIGFEAGVSFNQEKPTAAQKAKNKQMRDMVDKVETAQQGIDTDEFKKQCEDIDKGES